MSRHAHLVGSVNLRNAEETMSTAASIIGEQLLRLPDGEPGPRRGWISWQKPMFEQSRYLIEGPGGRSVVQPGVRAEDIEFPDLGYAREALASYAWFREQREAGKIPRHLRFQVSLPTPYACVAFSVAQEAIPLVEPAYEAAMLREVATICTRIPHEDLAIQWDIAVEMVMFDGRVKRSWTGAFDDTQWDRLARLIAAVPPSAHLGFHLCYGSHLAVIQPDSTKLTAFANRLTEIARRSLQWIHVPVPIDRKDDAYFAPFAELKLQPETEFFLGLVHLDDGVAGSAARITAASKFLDEFGIGSECGIGRINSFDEVRETLKLHGKVAAL